MTKLTFKFLTFLLFILICGQSQSFASSFLCSRVHQPNPGSHSASYANQVVFSSAKLDELLSSLVTYKGSESKAAVLAHMRLQHYHDFRILENRINLAIQTIDTLSNDSHFNKLEDRTKALIYRDLTDSLFSTAPSRGISLLIFGDKQLYFPPIGKGSVAALFIQWTQDLRSGQIDSEDRHQVTELIFSYAAKAQASQSQFLRVDNQLALIHLTYRKEAARAEEITKYAMNLVNALNNYDLSLPLRVNDLPVSEAQYLNAQLTKIQDELNLVYGATSSSERLSLQTDRVMSNLARYQEKLNRELSLYPDREMDSLHLAAMWSHMTEDKSSNLPAVDLY